MISFVVPAHNEEASLPCTLEAIHLSARAVGQPYEIIVVNDASTDRTEEVARENGARVIRVQHRQIAATRNSGARAAAGERIFFVDADTTINPRAVAASLRAMDKGAVGGGAPVWLGQGEVVPLYVRVIGVLGVIGAPLIGFTGGAFLYCTRAAFDTAGGFNEKMFWAEEGGFAMALKSQGRFVVIWTPVRTSGRRFRKTSAWQLLVGGVRTLLSPVKMMTQRSAVANIWYDSNRADDDKPPHSLVARISNAIALVLLLVLLSGPLWNFIPHSLTPLSSPAGKIRFVCAFYICHLLLICWPMAGVLLWHLLRRKQWVEWIKLAAIFAYTTWQAWAATAGVIALWGRMGQWLAPHG